MKTKTILTLALLTVVSIANGQNNMKPDITPQAQEYHERMFPGYDSKFKVTDPEFIERFDNFAFDEVNRQVDSLLDDHTRFITHLAYLLGCQGIDEFRAMLPAALNMGVTPEEVKEIVYQAVAYCGIGRIFPFLKATNEVLETRGIQLPLAPQARTTTANRLEAGIQAQVDIFGEGMREFYKSGPEDSRHINHWLADNCFGDYYTRGVLDLRQRELITFCFLAAQGGCEPQLTSHASANLRMGNTKDFLIAVISANIPFIGYPRSLNALGCVRQAVKNSQQTGEATQPDFNLWPKGELNTAFAKYFIGNSYLAQLDSDKGGPMNVTFEPGCRNNWHIHHKAVQVLICVSGRGWYQEWGKEAIELKPGVVVVIPAEAKHWHGAAKDSWMQHLTYHTHVEEGSSNEWLEPVTDEVYNKLK